LPQSCMSIFNPRCSLSLRAFQSGILRPSFISDANFPSHHCRFPGLHRIGLCG
jgi:hypothetical protein